MNKKRIVTQTEKGGITMNKKTKTLSVIIFGDQGIGKTTLAELIVKRFRPMPGVKLTIQVMHSSEA